MLCSVQPKGCAAWRPANAKFYSIMLAKSCLSG
jgi:hypothetical protein